MRMISTNQLGIKQCGTQLCIKRMGTNTWHHIKSLLKISPFLFGSNIQNRIGWNPCLWNHRWFVKMDSSSLIRGYAFYVRITCTDMIARVVQSGLFCFVVFGAWYEVRRYWDVDVGARGRCERKGTLALRIFFHVICSQ